MTTYTGGGEEPERMSKSIAKLAAALSKAQGEFGAVQAGRTGQTGHRKYQYADLNSFLTAVRPILSKYGLAVIQRPMPTTEDRAVCLETLLTHESGEWIGCELELVAEDNTPQKIGSALTYARRYSLISMIGIAPEEDDDGKAASEPAKKKATKKKATKIDAKNPSTDVDRSRIIRAAQALEYSAENLRLIIAGSSRPADNLGELTHAEAIGLAEALEKKFLKQQAEQRF